MDVKLTLKAALNKLESVDRENLIIRSDNGPQMRSNELKAYVDSLPITHEFTPISCPNKNAYIESFFSIFEIQFMQVRYFISLADLHRQLRDWLQCYNKKRPHGSVSLSKSIYTEFKAGLPYKYIAA